MSYLLTSTGRKQIEEADSRTGTMRKVSREEEQLNDKIMGASTDIDDAMELAKKTGDKKLHRQLGMIKSQIEKVEPNI